MIYWIQPLKQKQKITRSILDVLPEWFGIEEATSQYVKDVEDCDVVVKEVKGKVVGFIAVKQTSEQVLSLHVLGVLPNQHRQGIGKELFEAVKVYAKEKQFLFLSVKTLDSSCKNASYAKTLKFYQQLGFVKLETFSELWDKNNPCLMMICTVYPYPQKS